MSTDVVFDLMEQTPWLSRRRANKEHVEKAQHQCNIFKQTYIFRVILDSQHVNMWHSEKG